MISALPPEKLRFTFDHSRLKCNSTDKLKQLEGIIGQVGFRLFQRRQAAVHGSCWMAVFSPVSRAQEAGSPVSYRKQAIRFVS